MAPALHGRDPTAAYLFYDCQTDDVRLVLSVLGEAERFGAVCANRSEVTGLIERGERAAGVLVRDTEGGGERPVHTALLAAGVHVVEHLTNLAAVPASGARFTAAPPAIEGFGTFPVRAFATM